jgi:cytoskeletal protein CcmA (bactofilin family)
MRPPAIFKGAISSPTLDIAEGVVFEGASYMNKEKKIHNQAQTNAAY